MKLIFIATGKASSESANGVTNYCRLMLGELRAQKVDVSYFGFSRTDSGGSAAHIYVKRNFLGFFKFVVEVAKQPASAVYVFHGILFPYFTILMLILVLMRRKYVIFPHGSLGTNALTKKNKYRKLYYLMIDRWFIRLAKAVFVTQKVEVDKCLQTQLRIEILPPFVEIASFARLSKPENEVSILYLGRGDYWGKGIDRTIQFLNSIDHRNDIEKITFSGFDDNELIQKIREEISPDFKKKLNFPGLVFGVDKQSILQSHSHFVLFSRSEGLPLSLMEAACSGLFCLYSKETNFAKYNQKLKVGQEVKEFDSANRWLKNTLLQNNSGARAREFFKIEHTCKILLDKLEDIL